MNPVEKAIQKLAGEINPKIVFVAVSSGVDSTLLLDLLSTYFNVESTPELTASKTIFGLISPANSLCGC